MAIVATERGLGPDDWDAARVLPFDVLAGGQVPTDAPLAVEFPIDRDPAELAPWLDRLAMIRIVFPAMGDGRGFSIARRLRGMGYLGRLRAAGPLVADQVAAARGVGFDEIELTDAVAARQPEPQWRRVRTRSYQRRLLGD